MMDRFISIGLTENGVHEFLDFFLALAVSSSPILFNAFLVAASCLL
jgi:hypothetical protein